MTEFSGLQFVIVDPREHEIMIEYPRPKVAFD